VRFASVSSVSIQDFVDASIRFSDVLRQTRSPPKLRDVDLPGSNMIPAEQAVRTLLALKLIRKERKSHVMDLVFDEGIALFAGLNVVPKRSYLAAYSSSIGQDTNLLLMAAWSRQAQLAGTPVRFVDRSGFSHGSCQHPGRAAGKTLRFQPQPESEGRSGFPGARRHPARSLLRARGNHQDRATRRDSAFCRLLEKADRIAAR
jgi:hypothetical protein